MRVLLAALAVSALAGGAIPAAARADVALTVRGEQIGPDGVLTRQVAEVVGSADPTTTPVLAIDAPPIAGRTYAITGTVAYEDVAGDGAIEMWTVFADGSRYFTRTLDVQGPLSKLAGSSVARPFALPFALDDRPEKPTRLELDVVLPGSGRVHLAGLRFESAPATVAEWWSPALAGRIGSALGGGLGLLGAAVGVARARRSARRSGESIPNR
jgi:hypothetical protein